MERYDVEWPARRQAFIPVGRKKPAICGRRFAHSKTILAWLNILSANGETGEPVNRQTDLDHLPVLPNLQSRRTPLPCRADHLLGAVVPDISGSEYARDTGFQQKRFPVLESLRPVFMVNQAVSGNHKAPGIEQHRTALQEGRIGYQTDKNKDAVHGHLFFFSTLVVENRYPVQLGLFSKKLFDLRVPEHGDLGMAQDAVLDNLGSFELVAAHQNRDMVCELGQEQRLLCRAVAAADHRDLFTLVEGSVTGCAEVHSRPRIVGLARDVQPFVSAAGGDEHGLGAILTAVCGGCAVIVIIAVDSGDILGLQQLDPESLGLFAQPLGKLSAGHTVMESRHVVQFLRAGGLAAKGGPLDNERIDGLPGRIQRRGQSGGPSAQHDQFIVLPLGFCL